MDEITGGLFELLSTVLNGTTHPWYDRVSYLADEYRFYTTAEENLKERLSVLREYECDSDLELREAITNPSNVAVYGGLVRQPNSLASVNGKKIITRYEDGRDTSELDFFINTYFGENSIEYFTYNEILELSYLDPNAWLLVDFKAFDNQNEKAKPYPVILRSDEVINFNFDNGVPKSLTVKKPHSFIVQEGKNKVTKHGFKYFVYTDNYSFVLYPTGDKTGKELKTEDDIDFSILDSDSAIIISAQAYRFEINEHNTGCLQATRIGYKKDPITYNNTLVSFIHPALSSLREVFALSTYRDMLHNKQAFPRILAYVPPCDGETTSMGFSKCNAGVIYDTDDSGRKCNACGGKGIKIPKSELEGVFYDMPKNPEVGMPSLENMIHIERADIENLKHFIEAIKEVKQNALEAVYGHKANQSTSGTESYRSRLLDAHEQNKALKPLASNLARLIRFQVDKVARITENDQGLINIYEFPQNLGFVSNLDLIEVVKLARESNLPNELILPILEQQAIQEFSSDTEGLARFQIAKNFKPFFGHSSMEIGMKIDRNLITDRDKYLHCNFDSVLNSISNQYGLSNFVLFPKERAAEIINGLLNSIIDEIGGTLNVEFEDLG